MCTTYVPVSHFRFRTGGAWHVPPQLSFCVLLRKDVWVPLGPQLPWHELQLPHVYVQFTGQQLRVQFLYSKSLPSHFPLHPSAVTFFLFRSCLPLPLHVAVHGNHELHWENSQSVFCTQPRDENTKQIGRFTTSAENANSTLNISPFLYLQQPNMNKTQNRNKRDIMFDLKDDPTLFPKKKCKLVNLYTLVTQEKICGNSLFTETRYFNIQFKSSLA